MLHLGAVQKCATHVDFQFLKMLKNGTTLAIRGGDTAGSEPAKPSRKHKSLTGNIKKQG